MIEHKKSSLFAGLGRNVFVLGVVSLLTDISSEMLYPVVPLFLTSVLHAPMSVLGLIEGIAECTASLFKGVAGWASDRLGRRRPFVVWGYGVSAVSKPLLFFAGAWPVVLVSRLIDRLGKGLRTSPRDAMIAASCAPEARGKAFGLHRAMDTIGACIGPLLAIALLSYFKVGYYPIFLWAFVPAALGVAALFFVRPDAAERGRGAGARGAPEDSRAASRRPPLSPEIKRFMAVYGLFALGNSSDVFLLMKIKSIGYSATQVLLVYVFYNFVYALAAWPAGWLSDKIGRRRLISGGFMAFSLVYVGFAYVSAAWAFWALFALYGFYAAATEGIAKAYVTDHSRPENRGTALGALQTVTGLLAFAASTVAGLLWTHSGDKAPFIYGAACALLAAGLFYGLENSRTAKKT